SGHLGGDAPRAGDDAASCRGCGAGQNRKFGRETPSFCGVSRKITRPTKIEGMTKCQQTDITDQEIEGTGKQGKTHGLHQEERIGYERRYHQSRGHDHKTDGLALAAERRWFFHQWIGDVFHHALRPNSPAGRTSSTIAIITKITVLDASGKNTFVKPSMTPRPKPVIIAPKIDPIPPITTTANTTMISSEPIWGDTL